MTSDASDAFRNTILSLSERDLLLFGGKGGVGKTTCSVAAALLLSDVRDVTLFSSDPASNLRDVFAESATTIQVESVDAERLYADFLSENLPSLLELTDRGTLLDKEEARPFFELALPGIDELMSWLRIGDLVREADRKRIVIVDTAPTGHTLRMLQAGAHFTGVQSALEAMQSKHKQLIEQFTRRRVEDALDEFLVAFESRWASVRELIVDPARSAFVTVSVAEPWIVAQTLRLRAELQTAGVSTPFTILNRSIPSHAAPCGVCDDRSGGENDAAVQLAPVVRLPRACAPIDSLDALQRFVRGDLDATAGDGAPWRNDGALQMPSQLRTVFFAGKGGVGKSSSATSAALQEAAANPDKRFVLISVDPAHTLRDTFSKFDPPANLRVEMIDTREKWRRFREALGEEISNAIDSVTPRGVSLSADASVMRQLTEIAPPGADEIFAVMRLATLVNDEGVERIFVDTAPTGHFLRLIDLPRTAGEWVRAFMRLLLRYKELITPASLGQELLDAARSLRAFDSHLRSDACGVVLVARPQRLVVDETLRLRDELVRREVRVIGSVANYVTPDTACECDASLRSYEASELARLGAAVVVGRREAPPVNEDDLRSLVPIRQTRS